MIPYSDFISESFDIVKKGSKLSDVHKALTHHGWERTQGKEHFLYVHSKTGAKLAVPRHAATDMKIGLLHDINKKIKLNQA